MYNFTVSAILFHLLFVLLFPALLTCWVLFMHWSVTIVDESLLWQQASASYAVSHRSPLLGILYQVCILLQICILRLLLLILHLQCGIPVKHLTELLCCYWWGFHSIFWCYFLKENSWFINLEQRMLCLLQVITMYCTFGVICIKLSNFLSGGSTLFI